MRIAKKIITVFILIGVSFLYACDDEDDEVEEFPELDRGHTEVDKFIISFLSLKDSTTMEYTYQDNDGIGGNDPSINDTIFFERPVQEGVGIGYVASIRLFKDNKEVTQLINNNYDDYIFCFRNYDLDELILESRNNDPNGKELGIISEWSSKRKKGTNPDGLGIINITMNYQKGAKEILCNPGVRIISAVKPYKIR